ncbi:MAG: glycine cleavage system protein GcvH [Desulfobacterales bacterium]|nr:glycine cleavage system protein GcvH [Desulfobacterales bacterium]
MVNSNLNFPETVRYSKEHTWAKLEGETAIIGISDYAQNELGEIVYIQLPDAEDVFEKSEEFGFVESVKTTSDLYMPLGGKVLEINSRLEDNPEIINTDPFGNGWMLKIKIDDPGEYDDLLEAKAYHNDIYE